MKRKATMATESCLPKLDASHKIVDSCFPHPNDRTYFDLLLMCKVKSIAYDTNERTGFVEVEALHCVNMPTVVDLFEAIDPKVQRIYAGDSIYWLEDGEWCATINRGYFVKVQYVVEDQRDEWVKYGNKGKPATEEGAA